MEVEDNIYLELKKRIEELSPLTSAEWRDISGKWKRKTSAKNEFLLKPGQIESKFYFVYKGVHRVFGDRDGEEINVGFAYDGDYSGVFDSFLAQTPSELYLQSITASEMLYISFEDMMLLFDKYKSIERWGRLFNANMLIAMARRQMEARSFTAEEKFLRLLNQSPHIFQLVPLKHLASYLGMKPETLSRMRKKMLS